MKKIILSAAVAAMALSTSAFAADKGIDIVTTGQAVIYYETGANNGTGDTSLFDAADSVANVGVQLNLDADLKNGFTFGSQLSYLGTAGLEKNVVGGVKQTADDAPTQGSTNTELALTQINVAKTVANTTVKLGRQELPKSLSPFAYTEGWNVLKNTFDAILMVNSDIPNTTLVGAYVSGGTGMSLATTGNLTPKAQVDAAVVAAVPAIGNVAVDGAAYMLTAQNKSIPMTTLTISYYDVAKVTADSDTDVGDRDVNFEGASALWIDAAIAGKDMPMGLKVGLQGGTIMTESDLLADTTAMGAKVGIKAGDFSGHVAFTSVDGDDALSQVAIKNFGTGIKSPLYTQMVYNQDAISLDAETVVVKGAYSLGDAGTIIAQYGMTTAGKSNLMNRGGVETDYAELDVMYKVKAGGVQYFAAYINRSFSEDATNESNNEDKIRVWARLSF